MLQKSAVTDGCRSAIRLGPTGFDRPTLTLSTNSHATQYIGPQRVAAGRPHEPPQVLGDSGQNKLILGASWATKPKPTKPQDALQVCEPHLDLLALASRLLKALSTSERPGHVSGVLMDVARDLARWSFGQHCGLSGHRSQSSLQFEREATCAAAFATCEFRQGRQPTADQSEHQSGNISRDDWHYPIPRQLFHE